MELKLDNPASVAKPLGMYSHSVKVPAGAGLVFVSGQVPVRQDGTSAAGMAADQVYANLIEVLGAKGIAASAIIKLTTFLVDDDSDNAVPQGRRRHLGDHRPASMLVWVKRSADPAWKIEIEAMAMVQDAAC